LTTEEMKNINALVKNSSKTEEASVKNSPQKKSSQKKSNEKNTQNKRIGKSKPKSNFNAKFGRKRRSR